MTEHAKKKPPPPRPLKRSSLSGNQTLKPNSELPFEARGTSEPSGARHNTTHSDIIEPEQTNSDLGEAIGTIAETSLSEQVPDVPCHEQTATDQPTNDASFIGHEENRPQDPLAVNDNRSLAGTDNESFNSASVIGDDDLREKLMDVVEVILSVDTRLKQVEKKFEKSIPEQKGDVDKEKPSKNQPCVPQIKVLDWYNFKHQWTGDKRHAIEVLKGPAKYYRDWGKERRKYEKAKKSGNTPVRSQLHPEPDALPPQDVPERIRIVSTPLIAILAELDPLGPPIDLPLSAVMLRPYRLLIRTEDSLMKHLSYLEAKWGVAEKEDLEREAGIKSVPTEDKLPAREYSGDDSDKVAPHVTLDSQPAADSSSEAKVDASNRQIPTPLDPLTDSIEALRDLRCLKRFFETYLHPTITRLRNRTARKIRFADLWYLFPHGEEVFMPSRHGTEVKTQFAQSAASSTSYQSVYRVYDHSGGRQSLSKPDDDDSDDDTQISSTASRPNPFHLECYHIDWSSKSYWPVSLDVEIKAFDNERDITSLEVYPTDYHEKFEPIRQQLLERGRKFLKLTKPTHMNYFGRTYSSHPCGPLEINQDPLSKTPFVESEIMVDFEQISHNWRPVFGLGESPDYPRENIEAWDLSVYRDKDHSQLDMVYSEPMYIDYVGEKWMREQAREKDSFLHEWDLYRGNHHDNPIQSLERDTDIILLPSRVMGYSFRDRTFNAFNIDQLEPIAQGSEGFDGLELPKGHQRMVEALVKEHLIKKEAYAKHGKSTPGMDIVAGKGKGLIMLLHGAPGVGKTSTAECVAQSSGRPLFPITCGDLGLEPKEVEDALNDNFRLAALWNCVMLLDEADIFLAKRDKLDMRRNALVSVFLRVLEYYEGILFLTTNRVGTLDDAFKSRIHVSLSYPALTKQQTIKIWQKNLNRLRKIEDARAQITGKPRLTISDDEIVAYAREHYKEHEDSNYGLWNGRQIRNAFQTAAALAYHKAGVDGPILTPNLFKEVAKTTDDFDKYINELYGEKNEAERAYNSYERVDHSIKKNSNRNRHTHMGGQPATPVSNPRDRFFANTGPQDMQSNSQGGMMQISEHATLESSANSSRVFTETTRIPDNLYTSPGASWHSSNSPSVMAKAARPPTIDQGPRYNTAMGSDDEEEEED